MNQPKSVASPAEFAEERVNGWLCHQRAWRDKAVKREPDRPLELTYW
jgi:hypothetical protein